MRIVNPNRHERSDLRTSTAREVLTLSGIVSYHWQPNLAMLDDGTPPVHTTNRAGGSLRHFTWRLFASGLICILARVTQAPASRTLTVNPYASKIGSRETR